MPIGDRTRAWTSAETCGERTPMGRRPIPAELDVRETKRTRDDSLRAILPTLGNGAEGRSTIQAVLRAIRPESELRQDAGRNSGKSVERTGAVAEAGVADAEAFQHRDPEVVEG